MGEAETPSVSTYPYSFPALYRCWRDGPATLQRSDWTQIFQPCTHRLREGQSLACLGQAVFIYAAAPRYLEVRIVAYIVPIRLLAPQSKLSVPRL